MDFTHLIKIWGVCIMKKVFTLILCFAILFTFSACSSINNNTNNNPQNSQHLISTDNFVTYENIKYKVNPLLDEQTVIDYVDFEESKKETVTIVEIGWNHYKNNDGEGCKDILAMYYDNTLSNVQNGEQNVLGSVLYHRTDNMTTEWSYYDSESKLICKNVELNLYDKNGNLIATMSEGGSTFYDLNGNVFDFNSLDPFIETVTGF